MDGARRCAGTFVATAWLKQRGVCACVFEVARVRVCASWDFCATHVACLRFELARVASWGKLL